MTNPGCYSGHEHVYDQNPDRRGTEMGEAADDIVEGLVCSHCGIYFVESHGYPVLCTKCHKEDRGVSGLPKATNKELR